MNKKENKIGSRTYPRGNNLANSKGVTFVTFRKHANTLNKKRLIRSKEARGEASQNKPVKKARFQTQSKALEKSRVARIICEPSLGLLNLSKTD